jgi:hypothetical protein
MKMKASEEFPVRLWAKRNGNHIHIRIAVSGTITTITNNPHSERYHRTLFRNLRRVLVSNDRWPFGSEGSETEQRQPLQRRTLI